VEQAQRLVTADDLVTDLERLGVRHGRVLLVHCSLSSLGWVAGGEQAVVEALRRVLGPARTLVMPAQSWQLCDPAYLNDPAVPCDWWPAIREHLPAWDPASTPTRTMGAVAELFRTLPGVLRSGHPHRSFAAAGHDAAAITAHHELDSPVGEGSPLRPMYHLGGEVLLLGVGHDKSTTLHLAEDRAEYAGRHRVRNGAPMRVAGGRRWVEWDELWAADDDFDEAGEAFEAATGLVRRGTVGQASAMLLPQRELVDFATAWFAKTRTAERFGSDPTGWGP
jgi:aminoglycoside 3-N-acetyltransferase